MAAEDDDDASPTSGVRGGRSEPEQGFNAADPAQVAKRERMVRREKAQRDRDLRHLSSIPAFQRFVQRVLDDSGAFSRTYDVSKRRLIEEGRAMLAMEIFAELEATNPEVIIKIMLARLRATQEKE